MDTDGLDIVNWNVWADEEGLGRRTRKDKMGSMCMDIGRELERLGTRIMTIRESEHASVEAKGYRSLLGICKLSEF